MAGLFQSLEIGKRALLGHQANLQTIGHNIANVNTPGFSRQRVRVTTSMPESAVFGQIGTGFDISDIRNVRDLFLGQQLRDAKKEQGRWQYKNKSLNQIEAIFNEPQENSLSDTISGFWNEWSSLATDSDNSGNRSSLISSAQKMVNGFKHLAKSLNDLRINIDRDVANMTSDVNRMTHEIATLNQQIAATELGGNHANDLRDMRDRLTDELSVIIDVNVREKDNGASVVSMGAMILVDGTSSIDIGTIAERKGAIITNKLVWEGSQVELKNNNGQLAGLIEIRDVTIQNYLEELNDLAKTMVEEVNKLHSTGYGLDGSTGLAFFDSQFTDASTIKINQAILDNPNKLAASDSSNIADRSNGMIAGAISDLRDAMLMGNNSSTMNGFYNSLIGSLGVETREAESFANNMQLLTTQINNQKQSVEGVSLDEEMASLIKYQHAYDAAARVITVIDQALDTVIRSMGIVGR